jgi:hypothetical protein
VIVALVVAKFAKTKMSDKVDDSIGRRVVAKSCAKNPTVALEAADHRHQVSELKEKLAVAKKRVQETSTSWAQRCVSLVSRKQKVLSVGSFLVKELVAVKMLESPEKTESEVLVGLLTDASVEAFGDGWTHRDVDEIRQWCVKDDGSTVVGQLRAEVARNATYHTPVAAVGPVQGEGLGEVGTIVQGVSQGCNMIVVAIDLEDESTPGDAEDSESDEPEPKRRRVSTETEEGVSGLGGGDDDGGSDTEDEGTAVVVNT